MRFLSYFNIQRILKVRIKTHNPNKMKKIMQGGDF
jgi:hypothetical protein